MAYSRLKLAAMGQTPRGNIEQDHGNIIFSTAQGRNILEKNKMQENRCSFKYITCRTAVISSLQLAKHTHSWVIPKPQAQGEVDVQKLRSLHLSPRIFPDVNILAGVSWELNGPACHNLILDRYLKQEKTLKTKGVFGSNYTLSPLRCPSSPFRSYLRSFQNPPIQPPRHQTTCYERLCSELFPKWLVRVCRIPTTPPWCVQVRLSRIDW
jgi:hypothetical protein